MEKKEVYHTDINRKWKVLRWGYLLDLKYENYNHAQSILVSAGT